jgi:8-oxo-dGTP diphosphatase
MKRYVLAFLFSTDGKTVWLIRKTRPDWQKGLLNGIGGKEEEQESSYSAVIREFREETGLNITEWTKFCTLSNNYEYPDWVCHCYFTKSDLIPKTTTDEEVISIKSCELPENQVVWNLHWLIPMALTFTDKTQPYYVIERMKYDT